MPQQLFIMSHSSTRDNVLVATACGVGMFLMAKAWNSVKANKALVKQLQDLQVELEHEREKRQGERVGRIRTAKELNKLTVQLQLLQEAAAAAGLNSEALTQASTSKGTVVPSYPLKPLGTLQSCFTTRNGTPRQPLLVTEARSVLTLHSDIPSSALDGITQYSHCWVLYIFHKNTDVFKVLQPGSRAPVKSKIKVPRLDGGTMGVLATRSPHRPAPVGLSIARIIEVRGNKLVLGGADIVDGSPVLDIKPYVPFCDSVPTAIAPDWVQADPADDTLKLNQVEVPEAASKALAACWRKQKRRSLYPSPQAFEALVRQVLGRDIRNLNQRVNVFKVEAAEGDTAAAGAAGPAAGAAAAGGGQGRVGSSEQQGQRHGAGSSSQAPAAEAEEGEGDAEAAAQECAAGAGSTSAAAAAAPAAKAGGLQYNTVQACCEKCGAQHVPLYNVVLERVFVTYHLDAAGRVRLCDAVMDELTAEGSVDGTGMSGMNSQ